ncbi:O-antigen ligase family protein, partial [Bacillus xiapuensis]|nr:O-antigen ligase family protein [Bacillus xiapuensis]
RLLFIKDRPLEIGVLLLFILPPIGMLWLLIIGWHHIQRMMKSSSKFPFNVTVFFFICLMVSTIGAAITAEKLEYGLVFALLLGYLGLYLRAKESIRISMFKRYQWIVIAGGCYSVLTGFLPESLRAHPIWGLLLGTKWIGGNMNDPRLVGSEYNPNFACLLLLISFSLVLSKLLRKKEIFNSLKSLDWFLVLFLGYGIVATQSRAGVITMIIIFLLFLFRYRRKIGFWVSGAVVFLLPLLLHILPRSNLIGKSTLVRGQIWENSIRIWEQHFFFGTTPMGFQAAYSAFGAPVPHAHNILLAFFAEFGTLGGLGFVVLLLWTAVKYLSLVKCSSDQKIMLETLILSLPILLFTGILDHPLSSPQTALALIPLLSFWDRYTEHLAILDYEIRMGSIYRFFPAKIFKFIHKEE